MGTLCILDIKPRELDSTDLDTLRSLAKWVENELKLNFYSRSQKELIKRLRVARRKSLIDHVFGTWNEGGINTLLDRDIPRSKQKNITITIMLIQCNELNKKSNDSDRLSNEYLLSDVVQRLRKSVRPDDVVGRMDGGEFIIILEDCTNSTVNDLSKRIVSNLISEKVLVNEDSIFLHAKIGIVTNKMAEYKTSNDFMSQARDSLNNSIKNGNNKIYYLLSGRKGGYIMDSN
ncbi:MAG: diguanylate cyclase (GGDEF)-like protein [Gammaproteobacteria bacterium]|jgi:diguanylate cyclase (GGDEF)-like protein